MLDLNTIIEEVAISASTSGYAGVEFVDNTFRVVKPCSSMADDQFLADEINKKLSSKVQFKTREFSFPNGGHSMRKLANSLRELGDLRVNLHIEGDNCKQTLWFEAISYPTKERPRASDLADRLLLAGTRFTVKVGGIYSRGELDGSSTTRWFMDMEVHTKVSDIMHNPDVYTDSIGGVKC